VEGRQSRQPLALSLRTAVCDRQFLVLNIAAFLQALAKSAQSVRHGLRRWGVEITDHGHRRLLRARRERPRRRAAEQRDELASFKLIEFILSPQPSRIAEYRIGGDQSAGMTGIQPI
jgi:hypothetical protein